MQLWVRRRIPRDFVKGLKKVGKDFGKVLDLATFAVDVVEAWDLDEPSDVGGEELVVHDPGLSKSA